MARQENTNDILRVCRNIHVEIASQLGYSQEVIFAIKAATSECQINRIMIGARQNETYNPYFNKNRIIDR